MMIIFVWALRCRAAALLVLVARAAGAGVVAADLFAAEDGLAGRRSLRSDEPSQVFTTQEEPRLCRVVRDKHG